MGPLQSDRSLANRLRNRVRRFSIARFGRREFELKSDVPYISFTFDDFPRSAFVEGGQILTRHGARGTYFLSYQFVGQDSVSGPIVSEAELAELVNDGHELGCHTFDHLDGRYATASDFVESVTRNQAAVERIVPGCRLTTFAYPLDGPVLSTKRTIGRRFAVCRGGGQAINSGRVDCNLLNAYFLDWRNRGDLSCVRNIIAANAAARGWLIFATHDVAAAPSRYGCETALFEETVRLSVASGARVLPMKQVCQQLGIQ